jgi:hypothetical protein
MYNNIIVIFFNVINNIPVVNKISKHKYILMCNGVGRWKINNPSGLDNYYCGLNTI